METKTILLPSGMRAPLKPDTRKKADIPHSDDIGRMLVSTDADPKTYPVQAQTYAENLADTQFGAEISKLTFGIKETDRQHQSSLKMLEKLEGRKDGTPRVIQVAAEFAKPECHENGEEKAAPYRQSVPYKQWDNSHKSGFICAYVGALFVLLMGGASTFGAFKGSGIPAFMDSDFLCVAMAAIVPCGAFAVKSLNYLLPLGWPQRLYTALITGAAVVSFGAWAMQFAAAFNSSFSGAISWDDMESASISPLYSITQIIAEISIGAVLMMVADHIRTLYVPYMYRENIEYIALNKAYTEHLKAHTTIADTLEKLQSRLSELQAEREIFIAQKSAEVLSACSRYRRT